MSLSMALLNMVKKDQLLKENKDLIVIMVIAARLIFARNWENDNQLNLEEWYRELWEMAMWRRNIWEWAMHGDRSVRRRWEKEGGDEKAGGRKD